MILMGDNLLAQRNYNNQIMSQVTSQIDNITGLINNKFSEYDKQINTLSENTMTYSNFKRKLKYKFNKK